MGEVLGIPLLPCGPAPIEPKSDRDPGFGWRLSDAARRQIEEVERHTFRAFPILKATTPTPEEKT